MESPVSVVSRLSTGSAIEFSNRDAFRGIALREMRLRLAELIAALSLATDLGLGMPQEHVLRECRIALGLAERVDVDDDERAAVYYVALLAWVGCTADSHELAAQFGD